MDLYRGAKEGASGCAEACACTRWLLNDLHVIYDQFAFWMR